jgi:hypothetical protein
VSLLRPVHTEQEQFHRAARRLHLGTE